MNLLLLVVADTEAREHEVETARNAAQRACPGDPTALWLFTEFDSARIDTLQATQQPVPADIWSRARKDAATLLRAFPTSPDAWAAVGDAQLRHALYLTKASKQPFTTRELYRQAATDYSEGGRYADTATSRSALSAGLARSLIGYGDPAAALIVLASSPDVTHTPAGADILTAAEEGVHDWAAASAHAHRVVLLGANAYPGYGILTGETPLSIGVGRFRVLNVVLQPEGGGAGGGTVTDASYIPQFRPDDGPVGTVPDCPDWTWRRDAVLAGNADAALVNWPQADQYGYEFSSPDTHEVCYYDHSGATFQDLVRLESGEDPELASWARESLEDWRQNLWRWAGDYAHADQVARGWLDEAGPADDLPAIRLGEICFLRHQYDEAAGWFAEAAMRTRRKSYNNDLGVMQDQLDRGAALLRADRTGEAIPILQTLADGGWHGAVYQRHQKNLEGEAGFAVVAYQAHALLADTERARGQVYAAEEDYDAARDVEPLLTESQADNFHPERIDNNQALADVALHRPDSAARHAADAVRSDPANPVFRFTAASADETAADLANATREGQASIRTDPGLYPAANNLGVDLASQGHWEAADHALRQAVSADPSYALGWFNLGVIESHLGPLHLLASQGAFGRAISLDPDLSGRAHELTRDSHVYETGLDVSKPLPPNWSFASLQRTAPATSVGLLAAALVSIGLVRRLGHNDLADRWLEPIANRVENNQILARLRAPVFAVVVTIGVVWLPGRLRQPGTGAVASLATLLGCLLLVVMAMLIRLVAAHKVDTQISQRSWGPGLLLGGLTAAIGAPWAPMPVVETHPRDDPDERRDDAPDHDSEQSAASPEVRGQRLVHLAAPALLAVTALLLFIESGVFHVPLTQTLAVAALIMAASMLLPVKPLDGARIGSPEVAIGIGAVAMGALVVMGLI